MKFDESTEPIMYSGKDLNNLMSIMLASMTMEGSLTIDDGLIIKEVFNAFLDGIVNEKEACDELLKELPVAKEKDSIVSAAEKIAREVAEEMS